MEWCLKLSSITFASIITILLLPDHFYGKSYENVLKLRIIVIPLLILVIHYFCIFYDILLIPYCFFFFGGGR